MKRLLPLILAFVLCLCAVSCGKEKLEGDVMLKYGDHVIDKGTYKYLAATYKAAFLDSYNGGFDTDDFYDNTLEKDGRTMTYYEYIEEYIQQEISRTLISLRQFDESNLELTDEAYDDIEAEMNDLLEAESEDEINAALAPYGIDFAKLREIKLLQMKSEIAFSYLYENDGKKAPSTEEFEKYLNEKYRAVGIITVMTDEKYELDGDGNNVFDEEGNAKMTALTGDEKAEKQALIEKIVSELEGGASYDDCKGYSDVDYSGEYPLGIMISANEVGAYGKEIVTAALSMKEGDFKRVDTEGKAYILVCLKMPDPQTLGSSYDINELLFNCTTEKYMSETESIIKNDIAVNEDEISKIDLKELKKNIFY